MQKRQPARWFLALCVSCVWSLASSNTHAQYWALQLTEDDSLRINAQSSNGGTVFLAGEAQTGTTDWDTPLMHGWLAEISSFGHVSWSRTYDFGEGELSSIDVSSPTGAAYAAGCFGVGTGPHPGWLVKFSYIGSGMGQVALWHRTIEINESDNFQIQKVVGLRQGGVAGLANTEPWYRSVVVFVLDSDGNPRWAKKSSNEIGIGHSGIVETVDGSIILAANQVGVSGLGDGTPILRDVHLIKFGPTSDLQWARRISNFGYIGNIRSDRNGGVVMVGDDRLIRVNNDGDITESIKLSLPEYYNCRALHQTNDGWIVGTGRNHASLPPTMLTRLSSSFEPVWSVAINKQFSPFFNSGFEMDMLFLSGMALDTYDQGVNLYPLARPVVIRLDSHGEIEGCDLLTTATVSAGHETTLITESNINVWSVDLQVEEIEPEEADFPLSPQLLCNEPYVPPKQRTIFDRESVFELPIEICLELPEIIVPRGTALMNESGFVLNRGGNCNDVLNCPRCLRSITDGTEFLPNPSWRAELYQAVRPFRGNPNAIKSSEIDALATALEKTPVGKYFTADARSSLTERLARLREFQKSASPKTYIPKDVEITIPLARALHRIELDLVAKSIPRSTEGRDGLFSFGRLAWLRPAKAEVARGAISLELLDAAPAPLRGYSPGRPAAAFRLQSEKDFPSDLPNHVTFYYGGLRFQGPPERLRLLQWANGAYRDVTQMVDTNLKRISGNVNGLGTFLVVEQK